ncbi:MAG: glycosyltransferase family 2 protein [Planctomycetota bacterium]|jgi:glycosyltransferase involved in cell wall biosynthesis|nr:glycosyltransferase family 2 protein [Planctomycetota bacterium]
MRTAALIPAYQEERHVADVVRRTLGLVDRILVVDDGSRDRTAAVARAAGAEVFSNPQNLGKGAALAVGLDKLFAAGFDAVACLDADGQHDPAEIPKFIAAAGNADLVIGNRMAEVRDMPFVRLWTNRVTSRILSRLARVRVPDTQCGFRLIRREAWRAAEVKTRNFEFEGEMIVNVGRKGFRVSSVPVKTIYGDEASTINPWRDTIRFFRMIWRLRREG